MSRSTLLDILDPPGNPWLKDLQRGKAHLPAGVRLMRHSSGDTDTFESSEDLGEAKRKLRDVIEP